MRNRLAALAPGVGAALLVTGFSVAIGRLEEAGLGRAFIEPLVVAILIGMTVRTMGGVRAREEPGVRFVAKDILEIAVCLLGATMDIPRLFASGPLLAVGIALLVCGALAAGYAIGRLAGLPRKLAILVACGNAICGNSAIAAVAPVIDAERKDVAASIALTAVLGVVVVLGLPLLMIPLRYSEYQYGVLAGLTVYAVPQVLAAAFAVSALSGQVATAVKLARVLMLGPVVVGFSLLAKREARRGLEDGRTAHIGDSQTSGIRRPMPIAPWFVIGFAILAALRSVHVIPDGAAASAKILAGWLTIAAMAGLGLSVDLHSVKSVGGRVVLAVAGSLAALFALAILLIRLLPIR